MFGKKKRKEVEPAIPPKPEPTECPWCGSHDMYNGDGPCFLCRRDLERCFEVQDRVVPTLVASGMGVDDAFRKALEIALHRRRYVFDAVKAEIQRQRDELRLESKP